MNCVVLRLLCLSTTFRCSLRSCENGTYGRHKSVLSDNKHWLTENSHIENGTYNHVPSTVLEQDHFYSVFLYSLWTVLTNSHIRDDELKSAP